MHATPADLCLAAILAAAAATDLRTGRIYNGLTYPSLAAGLGAALAGAGPAPASALAGCLLGGGALYLMFAIGWMGGGDVKLMAAVGAFTGVPLVFSALFYSVFVGGVCAALVLIWRGQLLDIRTEVARIAVRRIDGGASTVIVPRGGTFPFGIAIAIGTSVAVALARV